MEWLSQVLTPATLPWRPLRARWLLACGLSGAVVLAALTLLAALAPRSRFDLWLLRQVQTLEPGVFEPVVYAVDQVTASLWANSLLLSAIVLAIVLRQRHAVLALGLLPVARFANHMLSRLVGRERPGHDISLRVVETTAASFPSGHVIGAVTFYGLLFLMAGCIRPPLARRFLRGLCALVIVLVGFGRVWYGAHFPSDVLAAYALALLSLSLIVALCQFLAAHASTGVSDGS